MSVAKKYSILLRLMRPVVTTEGNRGRQSRHVTTSAKVSVAVAWALDMRSVDSFAQDAAALDLSHALTQHEPTMGDYTLVVTT